MLKWVRGDTGFDARKRVGVSNSNKFSYFNGKCVLMYECIPVCMCVYTSSMQYSNDSKE